jgi:thiamine-phosphate pyrophosphorylase
MKVPRLVVLTDRSQLPDDRSLLHTVAACGTAGLEAIIVRELDLEPAARERLIARLVDLVPMVISARVPVKIARGLHVSAHQPRGGGWWGRSCHSRAELDRAAADGAAWATLSPFARTPSKPGYGPPIDHDAFTDAPLPVLALGGIDPGSAADAMRAGAHGVAAMGAVMRAPHPGDMIRALKAAVHG